MAKPELRDHRKFLRLQRLLGEPTPHVLGYLECLWTRGYQTGNPLIGDALDVEAAAMFPGEVGRFAKAAQDSGFIDLNDDGTYSIHDLFDHAPAYARKRMVRRGTQPEGVSWESVRDEGGVKSCPNGRDASPDGQRAGRKRPARTTEPRTKNQEPKAEKPPPQTPPPQPGAGLPADAGPGRDPTPAAVAPVAEQKPHKPRERNPLFDAVVGVTGLDPGTAGGLIGSVAAALGRADPPFTATDVTEFGRRFWELCAWAAKDGRARPTAKEVERYIGLLRAAPPPHQRPPPAGRAGSKGEQQDEYFARMAEDALFGDPPP